MYILIVCLDFHKRVIHRKIFFQSQGAKYKWEMKFLEKSEYSNLNIEV